MIFVVIAAVAGRDGCRGGAQAPPSNGPCEEQPPIECIAETIEQASSSQFEHYVYCACVTDDGLSKGYVAASKNSFNNPRASGIPSNVYPN